MRVWDLPPSKLCRKHLLAEHREIHAVYSILLNDKKGYKSHPETLRWVGKLPTLYKRHELVVEEMRKRGYKHNSSLTKTEGKINQDVLLLTIKAQEKVLREKDCECIINGQKSKVK